MKLKSLFILSIFLVGILALSGLAGADLATDIDLDIVEANDVELSMTFPKDVEKTDDLDILVVFSSNAVETLEDVQLSVSITGYDKRDKDKLFDSSRVFDVKAGRKYDERLTIELPDRMDRGTYNLKLTIDTKTDRVTYSFPFEIESIRDPFVKIRDVILSPASGVKAGRALLATVRVQNRGDNDEDDVKVTFAIPELGISASDFIDDLEADEDSDDSKSSEELYLRIPVCAQSGVYDGIVRVEYDDGDEETETSIPVEVFADETCDYGTSAPTAGKSTVTVGPQSQDVTRGASAAIYPVTITNAGNAKTYTVSVTGGNWGSFRVSPTNVVTVGRDDTKTVYVFANANAKAPLGNQVFGVEIMAGDSVLDTVTLTANVVGGSTVDFKRALELGLIALVVILVILGLIIGFNKLKGDEEKGEGETYY